MFGTPSKWGKHRANWGARSRTTPRRRTPPRRPSPPRASSINSFNRAPRTRNTLNNYVYHWTGTNTRKNKLKVIGLLVHPNKNPKLNKAKLDRLARLYTELMNEAKRRGVPSSRQ